LFWGVKLITGFTVRHRMLHLTLFIIWIAAIISGVVVCIAETRNYAWHNESSVETHLITPTDTLYLTGIPSSHLISNNPIDIYFDKYNQYFYGKPTIRIRKSEDAQIKLSLYRESKGESKRAAYQYAEDVAYNVEINDSLLIFDPYFTVIPQNKWKFQSLQVILYIPVGTVIIVNDTFHESWFYWINGENWILTEKNGVQPSPQKRDIPETKPSDIPETKPSDIPETKPSDIPETKPSDVKTEEQKPEAESHD
jgi:hypothetical protein